jgi:hypothetical protein
MTPKQTISTTAKVLNKGIQTFTQLKKWSYKTVFILILFMSVYVQLAYKQNDQAGEVSIIDVRYKPEPKINLAAHKPGDLEVYRTSFMGNGYKVRWYQNENGKLYSQAATYNVDEVFDKASYKWTSDTSVAVRLYNKATQKDLKFEVFGNSSESGMSW